MQFASTTCLQANKELATHRSQVARCVARPLASISSPRDEVTGGFAAAAHREPIAGSISSRLSFQLSRLLNVLLQPEPLHRSSFSSSSMLLCERVALPACVVSSLQVWHTLRILALLASASIIVALGRLRSIGRWVLSTHACLLLSRSPAHVRDTNGRSNPGGPPTGIRHGRVKIATETGF